MRRYLFFFTSLSIALLFQSSTLPSKPSSAPEDWQVEMVRLVNQYRTAGCRCGTRKMPSVKPLKWNETLALAAKKHASDMHRNDFIGHSGSNGSSIGQRVDKAGYDWRAVAENVAWNVGTAAEAVHAWKDSPGHCLNMMGGYTEIGAAKAGAFWVQVFAVPIK